MHEILDSLKSEITLDGLVGAVVLSDGADDTSALVESETQRHANAVPAGEQQQSMPSISPTPMSNLHPHLLLLCSPITRIASSLNSSSHHLTRTANTNINLSWNSSEVAERYRLHLGVDVLENDIQPNCDVSRAIYWLSFPLDTGNQARLHQIILGNCSFLRH